MHISRRLRGSGLGPEVRGGVPGRLLEGRGETVAVGETDLAGDHGQLVIGIADQPDGLLDSQMAQMVHRRTADFLEAKPAKVLETQARDAGERLGVPSEIKPTLDLIPESLHPRVAPEAAGETADIIIGQFDPLVAATRDTHALELGEQSGDGRAQRLGVEVGEHRRTCPEDGVRAHAPGEADPTEVPALAPADAEGITDTRRLQAGLTGCDGAPATIDPNLPLTAQAGHEEGAALVGPDDLIRRQHLGHAEVGDFEKTQLLATDAGQDPRTFVLVIGGHHDLATGTRILDVRLGMTELRLAVMF